MEPTAEKEGGVLGSGMETSRGTLLSYGIPPLLSSLWLLQTVLAPPQSDLNIFQIGVKALDVS